MQIYSFRSTAQMIDQIKAAAHAECVTAGEWLRRVVERALSGVGDEARRLRQEIATRDNFYTVAADCDWTEVVKLQQRLADVRVRIDALKRSVSLDTITNEQAAQSVALQQEHDDLEDRYREQLGLREGVHYPRKARR